MPSLIFSRWPEVVFDAPRRIDPGKPLPVYLIIKDADRYPVRLSEIVIKVTYADGCQKIARFPYGDRVVNDTLWWDSINFIPVCTGTVQIQAHALIRRGKKDLHVTTDNYAGTSRQPLMVYVSQAPLPALPGWLHGDIHCHSDLTSDVIEFGAPVEVGAFAGYCMGLQWIAVTDHSYDFTTDDGDGSPPEWEALNEKADMLAPTLTVIPGEEVTCRNLSGKNCHMLILNGRRFVPGSGDGGNNGITARTEHTIAEAASIVRGNNSVLCAAHPFERIGILERVILKRGPWTRDDFRTEDVHILQVHNGVRDAGFREGRKAWIEMLLAGRRVLITGGSDSHGDLNLRRRTYMPLVHVGESHRHTLGCARTVVKCLSSRREDILDGISSGRSVVTDGPFLDLTVETNDGVYGIGDTVRSMVATVRANAVTSRGIRQFKGYCCVRRPQ